VVAFGVAQVKQWDDPVALSRIIRDNIKNSLLAGSMDLSTANIAGVITIASEKILNELSQSHMDQALEHLNKTMRTGSTLHSGIYSGDKDSMNLFIAIGGLTIPGPQILSQNRRR
jgi:hypothetical protein